MSEGLTIQIHPDGYARVVAGAVTKNVSLSDAAQLLRLAAENDREEATAQNIVMPSGVHGVKWHSDGSADVVLYYPTRKVTVRHTNGRNYNVPLPNVILHIKLRKQADGQWMIRDSRWKQTPEGRLSIDMDRLDSYQALAMPNMYSDGRMCYGSNSLPGVIYRDWTILDMLYNDILCNSNFNNDLTVPGAECSGSSWLNNLDGMDEFPYGEC